MKNLTSCEFVQEILEQFKVGPDKFAFPNGITVEVIEFDDPYVRLRFEPGDSMVCRNASVALEELFKVACSERKAS